MAEIQHDGQLDQVRVSECVSECVNYSILAVEAKIDALFLTKLFLVMCACTDFYLITFHSCML